MLLERFVVYYEDNIGDVKVAFFDCDGTLSIPCYNVGGVMRVGMPESDWISYNIKNKNSYKSCIPVQSDKLLWLLNRLQSRQTCLNVLTEEYTSFAYFNKVEFILSNFGLYFDRETIHFCNSSNCNKVELMLAFAKAMNLSPSEILFVDDSFNLCIEASNAGFKVLHTSYFA